MNVIVKRKADKSQKSYHLPFSIGDVVLLNSYGYRFANQDRIAKVFRINDLNLFNALGDYFTLDKSEYYSKMQWKIKDILTTESLIINNSFGVRIINREKKELLIICRIKSPIEFKIVRKSKKQIKQLTINID